MQCSRQNAYGGASTELCMWEHNRTLSDVHRSSLVCVTLKAKIKSCVLKRAQGKFWIPLEMWNV